jgi:GTPase involved in cell partitioning and DNA repair
MSTLLTKTQSVAMCEEDSIKALLNITTTLEDGTTSNSDIFDVIFLDGDHNYKTVSSELDIVNLLLKSHGLVIIDDFDMIKDEFFGEKEEYVSKNIGNKKEDLIVEGKEGVYQAVCDFVEKNNEYKLFKIAAFENESPVMMSKIDLSMINSKIPGLVSVVNIDDE